MSAGAGSRDSRSGRRKKPKAEEISFEMFYCARRYVMHEAMRLSALLLSKLPGTGENRAASAAENTAAFIT